MLWTDLQYGKIFCIQSSIKMSPFEALYGRKCHRPLSWIQPEDKLIHGPVVLQEMERTIKKIQQNVKTT